MSRDRLTCPAMELLMSDMDEYLSNLNVPVGTKREVNCELCGTAVIGEKKFIPTGVVDRTIETKNEDRCWANNPDLEEGTPIGDRHDIAGNESESE